MAHSDAELVYAVLGGDKSAYAELYDRYAGLVRAVCCDTTADLASAQDLSQEVFLRAYAGLPRLRDPARFGKWLVGFARMVCREWRRGRLRDRHRYIGIAPESSSASAEPLDAERVRRLRKAIRLLPEKERLALHAFYLRGQSAEQARAVLGFSLSGFYRVMARARKRLERMLRNERVEVP